MDAGEVLDFDLSKENIQPLRQGRKAAQLETALQAQSSVEIRHQLLKERDRFELLIRMYDGDDPLQPRWEYVEWMEQSHLMQGPESNLIHLLENTITSFKDEERYKNDIRYVKLVIKYIYTQSNPLELFQLFYNQGLCTMTALFYKAWAEEFDKYNQFKDADKIYKMGITARAEPLDELEAAHMQFQLSVGRRMLEGDTSRDTTQNESTVRSILSQVRPSKFMTNRKPKGPAGILQPLTNRPNQAPEKINVHVEDDEDCKLSFRPSTKELLPKSSPSNKENTMKASKWAGQKQKQDANIFSRGASTPSAFKVHVDPDAKCTKSTHVRRMNTLKPHKDFSCPVAIFEPPNDKVKAMYPKDKVYAGGCDFSLEELMAAIWMKKYEEREKEKNSLEAIASNVKEMALTEEDTSSEESRGTMESGSNFTGPILNMARNNSDLHQHSDNSSSVTSENSATPITRSQNEDNSNASAKRNDASNSSPISSGISNASTTVNTSQRSFTSNTLNGSGAAAYNLSCNSTGAHLNSPASTSYTINTKVAMSAIQQMWASPSPQAMRRKTDRFVLPEKESLFKVPVCPRSKSIPFKLYTDDEDMCEIFKSNAYKADAPSSENAVRGKFQIYVESPPKNTVAEKFQVYVESPSRNERREEPIATVKFPVFEDCEEEVLNDAKNIRKADFQVYVESSPGKKVAREETHELDDNANKFKVPKSVNNRRKTQYFAFHNESVVTLNGAHDRLSYDSDDEDHANAIDNKENRMMSLLNVSPQLCSVDDEDGDLASPLRDNQDQLPLKMPMALPHLPPPAEDEDTPLDPEDKENCPPKSYAVPIERRPVGGFLTPATDIPIAAREECEDEEPVQKQQLQQKFVEQDRGSDLDDLTCNTRHFELHLVSSTPFRSNAIVNRHSMDTTYPYEDEDQRINKTENKTDTRRINQDLSVILEGSKERFSSSSGSSGSSASSLKTFMSEKKSIAFTREPLPEEDEDDSQLMVNVAADPFDQRLIERLLKQVKYPLERHSTGYTRVPTDMPIIKQGGSLKLGGDRWSVIGELGRGSYARVIRATYTGRITEDCALKLQKPACNWEWYIAREIQCRIKTMDQKRLFTPYKRGYIFNNGSILATEWAPYGSLLNLVNVFKASPMRVCPTFVCTYLSIQLISAIEYLHTCKIIHADVKPDNFLLHSTPSKSNRSCVQLTDFGRSIDMTLFPEGTSFTYIVTTDSFQCHEMKENKPWTYQTDLFGLAGTIYILLIGEYMKTKKQGNNWNLTRPIPRYMRPDVWDPILMELLNVPSCSSLPDLTKMKIKLENLLNSYDKYSLNSQFASVAQLLNKK